MIKVDDKLVEAVLTQGAWANNGFKIAEAKQAPKAEESKPVVESKKEEKPAEKHVCPLCESELKDPISDEQLLEAAAEFQEIFEAVEEALAESLNEEEDLDTDEDSDEDEDEDSDDEDEVEDEDEEDA